MDKSDWHWWCHLHVHLTRPFLREPPQEWWKFPQTLTAIEGIWIALTLTFLAHALTSLVLSAMYTLPLMLGCGALLANVAHIVIYQRECNKLVVNKMRERMENACLDSSPGTDWKNYTGVVTYAMGRPLPRSRPSTNTRP